MTILRLTRATRLVLPDTFEEGQHVRLLVAGPVESVNGEDVTVALSDYDCNPRCPRCGHEV